MRVLERRLEEPAPRAVAVVVEVARLPGRVGVAEEPLAAGGGAVVLGREDLAVAEELSVGVDLLDEDPHPVAGPDVLVEVHVPGEHVGGEHGEAGVLARAPERLVQGRLDRDRDARDLGRELDGALRALERAVREPLDDPLVRGALAVA